MVAGHSVASSTVNIKGVRYMIIVKFYLCNGYYEYIAYDEMDFL